MNILAEPQVHLWTRDEYYKMAEVGLFEGKAVELIEGQVIEMSPMGSRHATAITLIARVLERAFGEGYFIRWQMPLAIDEKSEPEPDVAVVAGHVRDYKDAHPTTAALIVEVAETSLEYDRTIKGSLYAKAGIADYWIVNLNDRQLEVYRTPVANAVYPGSFGYADKVILTTAASVSPLVAQQMKVPVSDLLP